MEIRSYQIWLRVTYPVPVQISCNMFPIMQPTSTDILHSALSLFSDHEILIAANRGGGLASMIRGYNVIQDVSPGATLRELTVPTRLFQQQNPCIYHGRHPRHHRQTYITKQTLQIHRMYIHWTQQRHNHKTKKGNQTLQRYNHSSRGPFQYSVPSHTLASQTTTIIYWKKARPPFYTTKHTTQTCKSNSKQP